MMFIFLNIFVLYFIHTNGMMMSPPGMRSMPGMRPQIFRQSTITLGQSKNGQPMKTKTFTSNGDNFDPSEMLKGLMGNNGPMSRMRKSVEDPIRGGLSMRPPPFALFAQPPSEQSDSSDEDSEPPQKKNRPLERYNSRGQPQMRRGPSFRQALPPPPADSDEEIEEMPRQRKPQPSSFPNRQIMSLARDPTEILNRMKSIMGGNPPDLIKQQMKNRQPSQIPPSFKSSILNRPEIGIPRDFMNKLLKNSPMASKMGQMLPQMPQTRFVNMKGPRNGANDNEVDSGDKDVEDAGGDEEQPSSGSIEEITLSMHNKYRRKHGVPDLKWCPRAARIAQKYAQALANGSASGHNPKLEELKLGENIFEVAASWKITDKKAIEMALDDWYAEGDTYDYGSSALNHFTQVIWKNTKKVGLGIGRRGNAITVVADYDPAGNDFSGNNVEDNVLPPLGTGNVREKASQTSEEEEETEEEE